MRSRANWRLMAMLFASSIPALASPAAPVSQTAGACADLLLRPLLFYETTAAVPSAELVRKRLDLVVRHQNQLRREANLPPVRPLGAQDPLNLTMPHRAGPNVYANLLSTDDPGDVAVNMPVMIAGNLIFRPTWGDTHGLNYVYEFEGETLKRAVPLPTYLLDRFPTNQSQITLSRFMSPAEARLWATGDLASLRKGGHDYGYGQPVTHFSINPLPLDRSPWGAAADGNVLVTFSVPKDVLADWTKTRDLAAGVLDFRQADVVGHPGGLLLPDIEFVIKQDRWSELIRYLVR